MQGNSKKLRIVDTRDDVDVRFIMRWWCVVRYKNTPLGQLISENFCFPVNYFFIIMSLMIFAVILSGKNGWRFPATGVSDTFTS